jgi:hypothetical protein
VRRIQQQYPENKYSNGVCCISSRASKYSHFINTWFVHFYIVKQIARKTINLFLLCTQRIQFEKGRMERLKEERSREKEENGRRADG